MRRLRGVLALILALVMALGCVPGALAADGIMRFAVAESPEGCVLTATASLDEAQVEKLDLIFVYDSAVVRPTGANSAAPNGTVGMMQAREDESTAVCAVPVTGADAETLTLTVPFTLVGEPYRGCIRVLPSSDAWGAERRTCVSGGDETLECPADAGTSVPGGWPALVISGPDRLEAGGEAVAGTYTVRGAAGASLTAKYRAEGGRDLSATPFDGVRFADGTITVAAGAGAGVVELTATAPGGLSAKKTVTIVRPEPTASAVRITRDGEAADRCTVEIPPEGSSGRDVTAFAAEATDQYGEVMPGAEIAWSGTYPGVFTDGGTIAVGSDAEPGSFRLTASCGGASASVEITLVRSKPPATKAELRFELRDVVYDGGEQPVSVTDATGGRLGAITVRYIRDGEEAEPVDAGKYLVIASAAESEDYAAAEVELGEYTILPFNLGAARLGNIPAVAYRGYAWTPDVTVTVGAGAKALTLVRNRDYICSYKNNVNAGRAVVTATAISPNFTGSAETTFEIRRKPITAIDWSGVTASKPYDGNMLAQDTVTVTGEPVLEGRLDGADLWLQWVFHPFARADAGAYNLALSDLLLTGTAADNYEFAPGVTTGASIRATIVPREISGVFTVGFAANGDSQRNRIYDPGDTVRVSAESLLPAEAAGSVTYEWIRMSAAGEIPVGTGETYVLTEQDVGAVLYAVATGSVNYTGSVASGTISIGRRLLTGRVTILSAPAGPSLGDRLQANVSITSYVGADSVPFTLSWYRDGVRIEGADSGTYTVTREDLGKEIVCVATAAPGTEHTGSLVSPPLPVPAEAVGKPEVSVVAITDSAVTLAFSADPAGNTGVRYNVSIYTAANRLTATASSVTSPWTFTGLEPETAYNVQVTAYGAENNTLVTSELAITTPAMAESDSVIANAEPGWVTEEELNAALAELSAGGEMFVAAADGEAAFTGAQLRRIREAGVHLTVLGGGSVSLDSAALAALGARDGDTVVIRLASLTGAADPLTQQLIEKGCPAYELGFSVGGVQLELLRSPVIVTLPVEEGRDQLVRAAGGKTAAIEAEPRGENVSFSTDTCGVYLLLREGDLTVSLPFADVRETDWFYSYVQFVHDRGLMNGVSADRFAPNSTTTRAMLATVLYRIAGSPDVSGLSPEERTPFTDVAPGLWYSDAIAWAAKSGVVNGYGGGLFGPTDNVTRQQMVTMLYRFAAWQGREPDAPENALLRFADAPEVGDWAMDAMRWAVANGIVDGVSADTLAPRNTATRAQLAAILQRFSVR